MNPLVWVQDNVRVYLGNASARRDYRTQLRGVRPIYFWSGYLLMLVLLAGITYSNIVDMGDQPVAELQYKLRAFYQTTIRLLGVLLIFIAPALTATSIVSERMMKSLDLVFTSPMTPKHLLVGKMISSFRYTWMLLILALPITAVSVVMGGATWTDVLGAYVILSASALVVTSIGLLISALVNTAVAAVLWTYIAVGVYAFATYFPAQIFSDLQQFGLTGRDQEAPWVAALSPFWAAHSAPTHTKIGSWEVPNYLIAVVFAILFSKLMLLAAGSAMSPFGAKETKSLRVHLLLYGFATCYGLGYALDAARVKYDFVPLMGVMAVSLCLFLPFVIAGSRFADRKNRLEGPFNLLATLDGRPSGALPFLWLGALAIWGGLALGAEAGGATLDPTAKIALMWLLAFWTFWWAIGRLMSALTADLRTSRLMIVMVMLFSMGLPLPFATLSGENDLFKDDSIWRYYILHPLGIGEQNMRVAGMQHVIGLFIVATVIAVWAELARRIQYRKLQTATIGS